MWSCKGFFNGDSMKKQTRKIGIIGGVGPQATHYLYGKIIELSQRTYGAANNDDYPHLTIESLPIPDFISNTDKLPVALNMLSECVNRLEEQQVNRICIASNTVHLTLPELQKSTSIRFISMIDEVSEKCLHYGFKQVGLLGTPVLTKSNLYVEALAKRQIKLITPEKEKLHIIEEIIRGVLSGNHHNIDKNTYTSLIHALFDQGANAIILGCTELPLAIDYSVYGKRIINSDEVLAEAIVDYFYHDKSYNKNKEKYD
jgi:aspartate racemase